MSCQKVSYLIFGHIFFSEPSRRFAGCMVNGEWPFFADGVVLTKSRRGFENRVCACDNNEEHP